MLGATPIYRGIMLELERRRQQLGVSMERFSEFAGLPDRFYSKMLWPDTGTTGRQASWESLQRAIDGLYPDGVDIILKPRKGPELDRYSMKFKVRFGNAFHDRKSVREHMRELSAKGNEMRTKKVSPSRRKQIAKKAAKARWQLWKRRGKRAIKLDGDMAVMHSTDRGAV